VALPAFAAVPRFFSLQIRPQQRASVTPSWPVNADPTCLPAWITAYSSCCQAFATTDAPFPQYRAMLLHLPRQTSPRTALLLTAAATLGGPYPKLPDNTTRRAGHCVVAATYNGMRDTRAYLAPRSTPDSSDPLCWRTARGHRCARALLLHAHARTHTASQVAGSGLGTRRGDGRCWDLAAQVRRLWHEGSPPTRTTPSSHTPCTHHTPTHAHALHAHTRARCSCTPHTHLTHAHLRHCTHTTTRPPHSRKTRSMVTALHHRIVAVRLRCRHLYT